MLTVSVPTRRRQTTDFGASMETHSAPWNVAIGVSVKVRSRVLSGSGCCAEARTAASARTPRIGRGRFIGSSITGNVDSTIPPMTFRALAVLFLLASASASAAEDAPAPFRWEGLVAPQPGNRGLPEPVESRRPRAEGRPRPLVGPQGPREEPRPARAAPDGPHARVPRRGGAARSGASRRRPRLTCSGNRRPRAAPRSGVRSTRCAARMRTSRRTSSVERRLFFFGPRAGGSRASRNRPRACARRSRRECGPSGTRRTRTRTSARWRRASTRPSASGSRRPSAPPPRFTVSIFRPFTENVRVCPGPPGKPNGQHRKRTRRSPSARLSRRRAPPCRAPRRTCRRSPSSRSRPSRGRGPRPSFRGRSSGTASPRRGGRTRPGRERRAPRRRERASSPGESSAGLRRRPPRTRRAPRGSGPCPRPRAFRPQGPRAASTSRRTRSAGPRRLP